MPGYRLARVLGGERGDVVKPGRPRIHSAKARLQNRRESSRLSMQKARERNLTDQARKYFAGEYFKIPQC